MGPRNCSIAFYLFHCVAYYIPLFKYAFWPKPTMGINSGIHDQNNTLYTNILTENSKLNYL